MSMEGAWLIDTVRNGFKGPYLPRPTHEIERDLIQVTKERNALRKIVQGISRNIAVDLGRAGIIL